MDFFAIYYGSNVSDYWCKHFTWGFSVSGWWKAAVLYKKKMQVGMMMCLDRNSLIQTELYNLKKARKATT